MSQWIEQLKSVSVYDVATQHLGMRSGRLRSIGPCPGCNADKRGAADPRPPIGVGSDGRGWQCHACNAKGDVVEIICLSVQRKSSGQMQPADWSQLREWAVSRRLAQEGDEPTRQSRPRSGSSRAPVTSVSSILGGKTGTQATSDARSSFPGPVDPPSQPADELPAPVGRFAWRPGLALDCAEALWGADPDAQRARDYLLTYRKLSEATVREFGLGVYVIDGAVVLNQAGRPYVTTPLRDKDGRPVNVRYRSVPVPGTCPNCSSPLGCSTRKLADGTKLAGCKEYRVCVGRPLPLFGGDRLLSDKSVPVLIQEGEFDVMAMHTYGFTGNVVSGTAGAGTWANRDEWLDLIEPYDALIGMFDGDQAGEDGWKPLADKLGHYRTARCTLPKKDAGDCLAAGVPASVIERAVEGAVPMHGLAMRKADEFADQLEILIKHPELMRGTPTGSPRLDQLLGGWRPGVIVMTGESGAGKTSFATWATLVQARQGVPAMVTSFEQQPIGTVQKLLRVQVGRDFTTVTEEERRDGLGILGRLPLYILDHYGNISAAKLVEAIRYARRRLGVRVFLIDHLGFLIDEDADDERRAIEAVVRALAIVAKQMSVTIFLIVHPRNDSNQTGRGYQRVTMKHLKGASAIRQDADDVLVVVTERPDEAKGKRVKRPWPQSRIYADKVRSEFGISGGDVALAYDPGSCTYADEWADTPAGRAGLLVPRHLAPKEKPDPPADDASAGEEKPKRRRPPRSGDKDAGEGGDGWQSPLPTGRREPGF